MAQPTDPAKAAARTTRGIALHDRSGVAPVFYTASCGGHLERARDVWPALTREAPWLEARPDPVPHVEDRWSATLDSRQIEAALRAGGLRGGPLVDLRVTSRTASGRAATIAVSGFTPEVIGGDAFRLLIGRHLGWQHLESTWFDATRTAIGYRFEGRGKGHGIGLCVRGAERLARGGATRAHILATYFPGTTLGPQSAFADIRIVLPSASEDARSRLDRRARALLDLVVAESGGAPPASLTLRFHPTVESYQRATGQPWWTAAASEGDRVELLPHDLLVRRGLLDTTLAHELVHVVTRAMFASEPRWVREGAAVFFTAVALKRPRAGGHAVSPVACPSDADFDRARDAEALARLYVAAGDCFSRWRAARTPASKTSSQPAFSAK